MINYDVTKYDEHEKLKLIEINCDSFKELCICRKLAGASKKFTWQVYEKLLLRLINLIKTVDDLSD